jgi:hypothetical protein
MAAALPAATAEIFSGSTAIILRPIIRALRTIAAGAIAEEEAAAAIAGEEAATGAAEAIKLRIPRTGNDDKKRHFA